jgi:Zn-dependent protease/sulfur carrier protein ThiS
MNKNTIPLGRILGIPLGVDPSWFLIFILLTWTLATNYFPAEFSGWPKTQYWIVGAVTAIMLFVSVVLHELGHSVLALRYKIPVRSITLFVFGGVAQIGAEPPSAIAEFWIAIAGPVVSFVLAGIFRLLEPVVGAAAPILAVARYLAYINGTLGLFNLIPGFPLDGGRVFRAILWGVTRNLRRATFIAANVGRAIAFVFILVGVWQILSGNFGNGIWIAFIGWFLESAAVSQLRQQELQGLLAGHKVSEAMSQSCVTIPAQTTLQDLVDHHILGRGQRCLVVSKNGNVVGLLTVHSVRDVPREQWGSTSAEKVMIPMERMHWTQPEKELWEALENMDRDGVNQMPVMDHGEVVGMLSREDVINYLRTVQVLDA